MSAKIMVFDDSPELRILYTELLTDENHSVHTFDCASGGLAAVNAIQPDVLIVDGMFHHTQTSLDLIYALRTAPVPLVLNIILCTAALARVEKLSDELAFLKVTVLLKPFEIDDLLNAINNGLDEHESDGVTRNVSLRV